MQGAIQRRKLGYEWMRVGFATARFRGGALVLFLGTVLLLSLWSYLALPASQWRVLQFAALYIAAALLYLNFGVWIHEQLHCLPYRGLAYRKRTHIFYVRKHIVALHGWYRVTGPIGYGVLRRALLGPLALVGGWLVLGLVGHLFLPGWWLPLMLILAALSLMDMVHDLYWIWQTRRVGERGKYWDNGHELEVVWSEAEPAGVRLPARA